MDRTMASKAIEVKDLKKWFPLRRSFFSALFGRGEQRYLKAVDGVSFSVNPGEVLGLAGESGCGKTTTGMTITKLYQPTSGKIFFRHQDVAAIEGRKGLKEFRKNVQIVFQNPYESLNPRFTVMKSIEEPIKKLRVSKGRGSELSIQQSEEKYLPADWLKKYEGSIGSYEPRRDKRK